jgi:CRISPR-associated protein Cst2
MTNPLYSLSISARMTLDMHSLNNEGGEGNQIQTRMVNIVAEDGDLHNVNAVSGDMFKHIQAEHLFKLARESDNLPLCAGCREFNANRINADADFISRTKGMSDAGTLDELLRTCTIDDIEGILITEGGRSLPRKSVIEFGWVVGIPGSVETDSYFHVKYASSNRAKNEASRESEEKSGANLGQAIFHRPASSGVYAIVAHLDLARIGFNDIAQTYAISDEQRNLRAQALLQSLLYTFLHPSGAMRSAQAPHIVGMEGLVSISSGAVPAPTISPLKSSYKEEIQKTQAAIERIMPGQVFLAEFNAINGLAEIIGDLMADYHPHHLHYR